MKKSRVVFDTNVYISATVFPGGIPEELLKLAFSGEILLFVSKDILAELSNVYLRKFHLNNRAVSGQIKRILNNAQLVEPSEKITAIKMDKSDNKVLECAVACKAEIIVSGDFHLLEIKKFRNIVIIKPADFLRMYAASTGDKEPHAGEQRTKYLVKKVKKTKPRKQRKNML